MNVNPPITNFQQLLTSHHIPSDGSLVGGPDGTPTDPARIDVLFLVEGTTKSGSQYPDGEFYPDGGIKTQFGGGPVAAGWNFTLLTPLSLVEVLEFSLLFVDGEGYEYNGAFQIRAADGNFMVSSDNSPWTDTKMSGGLVVLGYSNELVVDYDFDTINKVRKVLSISFNGKTYSVPTAMQTASAVKTNWAHGIFLPQHQLGQTAAGGIIVTKLDGCTIS